MSTIPRELTGGGEASSREWSSAVFWMTAGSGREADILGDIEKSEIILVNSVQKILFRQ